MAGRVFNLPKGTMPPGYGVVYTSDAMYHTHVDDSKPIGTPPAHLYRWGRSTLKACIAVEVWQAPKTNRVDVPPTIDGVPTGTRFTRKG